MPGQTNGCGTQDGRLYKGAADLYQVPYADKAGGTATPVAGASTPENEEYYPAFSPDDHLIAFTRVPAGQEMFANPSAEMWVVPHQTGAQPKRLAANDPPTCSGKSSPGVNNHWPKWSPDRADGRQQDLLLADLLVEPLRAAAGHDDVERPDQDRAGVAALHHGGRRRRDRISTKYPGDLPVEPAAEPAEHDARLGQLPHLRSSSTSSAPVTARRRSELTVDHRRGRARLRRRRPMAYRIKRKERVGRGHPPHLARAAAPRVEVARDRDGAQEERVHDVRTRLKRSRAALALIGAEGGKRGRRWRSRRPPAARPGPAAGAAARPGRSGAHVSNPRHPAVARAARRPARAGAPRG